MNLAVDPTLLQWMMSQEPDEIKEAVMLLTRFTARRIIRVGRSIGRLADRLIGYYLFNVS